MSELPSHPQEPSADLPRPGEAPAAPPASETPTETRPSAEAGIAQTADTPLAPAPEVASAAAAEASAQIPLLPLEPGTIRRAKVIEVTPDQVAVDLGSQLIGRVPFIEFTGHPTPKVDDEVSVIVERYDPATGELVISKRYADEVLFWLTVRPGHVLEGVVTGMNKGGLDVDIGGARAFLPASQVDIHRMKDISTLIGEHVQCVVTQVDRITKDLVVSRRKAIEKQRKEQRRAMIESLMEGELHEGRITNLTDYGAFVTLGGADGLIHITDLSWGRVTKPADVVQIGQQVTVRILKVDREKGKISLGLKQVEPDPWEAASTRYVAGARVKGRVARLADFGAFIELEKGIDALLPLSEMSWSRHLARPGDTVQVGQDIETLVLKVEPVKRRISLSLRQLTEDPWTGIETRFPVGEKCPGKVSKITDFGAFVELAPGIEGLVHISELSARRVKSVADVVTEGQEVEVRVLKVDKAAQRISLSMKPPPRPRPAFAAEPPPPPARPAKKRKKPLRGGLASHFEW